MKNMIAFAYRHKKSKFHLAIPKENDILFGYSYIMRFHLVIAKK